MRGVAREEDAPRPVALRHLRRHRPGGRVEDLERHVVAADRPADDCGADVFGIARGRLGPGVERMHEDPRPIDVVRDERPEPVGVEGPVEDSRAVGDERPEVGPEVDHHEALDAVGPIHGDPERLPGAAAGAVGGHHPAAAHVVDLVAREIANAGADAAVVLLQALALVAVPDPTDAAAEALEEHRLEEMLREVQERRRSECERVVALSLVRKAAELLARQARDPRDVTAVGTRCGQRAEPADVDPGGPQDLEGPWIHHVRLRRAMGSAAPLHDEARDAEPREQDRGHEPDGARADDQHRDLNAQHRGLPGRGAGSPPRPRGPATGG
jgi:hypothetical protein